MTLSIDNWNVAQNAVWFVRLSDTGGAVQAGLYLSAAAAEAQTGLQASGESSGYGSNLEITLTNEEEASTPVSRYQAEYAWHLKAGGQNGDSARIFKVNTFVELDEIAHPVYRNPSLISRRAAAEIDAHTHAAIVREMLLGVHLPTADVADIVRVNSARRGVNVLGQVDRHVIDGQVDRLTSTLTVSTYLELTR